MKEPKRDDLDKADWNQEWDLARLCDELTSKDMPPLPPRQLRALTAVADFQIRYGMTHAQMRPYMRRAKHMSADQLWKRMRADAEGIPPNAEDINEWEAASGV